MALLPKLAMTVINKGKRGKRKLMPRSKTIGHRVAKAAKKIRKRGKLKGAKKAAFLARMEAGRKKAGLPVKRRRVKAKRNPSRKKMSMGALTAWMSKKPKKNPHRRAKRAGEKKMARKKGKLKGKAKEKFLRRMAAGRRKASAKSNPRKRKSKSRKSRKSVRRSHGRSGRSHKGLKALTRKIHKLAGEIKGGSHKGSKRHRRASPARARLGVLKQKRRAIVPGVSAAARKYLRVHGLNKVNRGSMLSQVKSSMGVVPQLLAEVGVGLVSFWGIGAAGDVAQKMWVEKYTKDNPAAAVPDWMSYVGAGVSWLATVLGFLGLRMAGPKVSQFSGTVLVTGSIASIGNLMKGVKVDGGDTPGAKISLGEKLMFPIQGSPLLPGLDLGINLQGMGDYTSRASLNAYAERSALNEYASRSAVEKASLGAYASRSQINAYAERSALNAAIDESDRRGDAVARRLGMLGDTDAGNM